MGRLDRPATHPTWMAVGVKSAAADILRRWRPEFVGGGKLGPAGLCLRGPRRLRGLGAAPLLAFRPVELLLDLHLRVAPCEQGHLGHDDPSRVADRIYDKASRL